MRLFQKSFQHGDTKKRVAQRIDLQLYFLCVTQKSHLLCVKIGAFEAASPV